MKLHRNLALAVFTGLKEILLEKKQADTTAGTLLSGNKSWGVRDRNFIADHIYGVVRYRRLYEFCLGEEMFGEVSLWKIFGCRLILENFSLPDWSKFEGLDAGKIVVRNAEAGTIRKIRESVPDWLDELGERELGTTWDREIASLNQPAKLGIRINTLKTSKTVIKKLFSDEGIEFSETGLAPEGLLIHSKKNFRNHPAYRNGLFEIQDISSQRVAPFLEAEPGMNVIDGCSG